MTSRTSERNWILFILVIALVLRVAAAFVYPSTFPDSKDYDALARAIIEVRSYEVNGLYATRMPGYPILVAGIYSIFGYHQLPVLLIQAILSTLSVYLVYLIGQHVSGQQSKLPHIAAALAAIDPLSIAFSASMLTETPFTTCLLAALLISLKLHRSPLILLWGLLALVWLIAVELRPAVYWCLVPLAALLIVLAQSWRARLLHVVGFVLVIALVQISLVPWQQRNEKLFATADRPDVPTRIRFTTLEGMSLYEAVYPEATGGPKQDVIQTPDDMKLLNEAQRNNEWSRRAWQFIREDPARIAGLGFIKMGRTWSPLLNAAEFKGNMLLQIALALWHIPLFAMAILGLVRRGISVQAKLYLLTPILYFTAIHALFLGSVRYRVPLAPIICVLAAAGGPRIAEMQDRQTS